MGNEAASIRDIVTDYHTDTPAEFIRRCFPEEPPPKHTLPILRSIQEASIGRYVRDLYSMPPGHAKSTTLVRGLGWWLGKYPADTHGYMTYAAELSQMFSRRCRNIVNEHTNTMITTEAVSHWETAQGGGLAAAGIRGVLTGKRISGVLIIDDPYGNRQDAESAAYKRMLSDWYIDVGKTRLMPSASVIVVHTRWAEDDLIGTLSKKPAYRYRNMPVMNPDGTSLWPEMFPPSAVDEIRADSTEWNFSALYEGMPRPRGANVFGPAHYHDPKATFEGAWRLYVAADTAASTKTTADYSVAGAIAARRVGALIEVRVLDVIRGQWTVPDFARRLREFQKRYRGAPVGIESVGGFKAVAQMLREIAPDLRIIEINPRGDKFQRAQPVAAGWNDGRVSVPAGAPWEPEFVREVTMFSGVNDDHDDQVDMLAHAYNMALDDLGSGEVQRGSRVNTGYLK